MDESSSTQTQSHIYSASRTDISQNQGKFRIHFNFPGQAVPDHDDHGYGPLATVGESLMDPGRSSGCISTATRRSSPGFPRA